MNETQESWEIAKFAAGIAGNLKKIDSNMIDTGTGGRANKLDPKKFIKQPGRPYQPTNERVETEVLERVPLNDIKNLLIPMPPGVSMPSTAPVVMPANAPIMSSAPVPQATPILIEILTSIRDVLKSIDEKLGKKIKTKKAWHAKGKKISSVNYAAQNYALSPEVIPTENNNVQSSS